MQAIKSYIYFVIMVITAILYSIPSLLTFPFSFEKRYAFIRQWARFNIWSLKVICGLDFEIKGKENIPEGSIIVLSKHQSTWETYAFQVIFQQHTWVLKKSLLKVPFFGWGLSLLKPVAIDRSARKKAMEQLSEQGSQRLDDGISIVIFPEGTRIAPGEKGRYKLGGARLAEISKRLVVPVAHNAGEFWPKHSMFKKRGKITVSVLPAIDPAGMTASEINELVETKIEQEMAQITTLKDAYATK